MPDRKKLQKGDSIRILNVPDFDLAKCLKEQGTATEFSDDEMLPTATVIELIIEQHPVVIIEDIDEYEQPWFSARLMVGDDRQYHSLAVMDDESWELVYSKKNAIKYKSNEQPPKEHQIAELQLAIDHIMDEYEEEYLELAEYSENQDVDPLILKKHYENLDKKTGLNDLFARIAILKES